MLASLLLAVALVPAPDDAAADLAAARELFERNIAAIRQRDRDGYLSCYWRSDDLARTGPAGPEYGWQDLADGTPPSDGDDWPRELVARDLRLHRLAPGWVYGTYRYRVDFGGEIAEGLSERLFRETDDGWRIVLTTAFDAPPGTAAPPLALVGATLHDGNGGAPVEDAVVVVRDGRFEAVGPRASTPVPDGVDVVDLSGSFLAPGLVDTHVHYSQTGWADGRPDADDQRASYPYEEVAAELEREPERFHRAFLACGVTAVFDVGGFPWTRRLGEATEDSSLAPHVAATGPLLSTLAPPQLQLPDRSQFVVVAGDEARARAAVRAHAAAGSDAIKFWYIVGGAADVERHAPVLHAIGEEARAVGLPLVVHATHLRTARVAVEAGASLLVHSVDDEPVDDAFVQACLDEGVFYCPTLVVSHGYGHLWRRAVPDDVSAGLAWVAPSIRERVERTPDLEPNPGRPAGRLERIERVWAEQDRVMAENLMTLHRAGVKVVLGTDAGNPLTLHGPSLFREAEAMQRAGMEPLAVLTAATRDAAAAMGRGDDLGLVEPGRVADLIVLARDPAEDVANLRSLTRVMRAGVLQARETVGPR